MDRKIVVTLAVFGLLLAACGGNPPATQPSPSVTATAKPTTTTESAAQVMARLYEAAKAEKEIQIYSSMNADDGKKFAGTLRVAAFLGDRLDCVVEIGDLFVRARAHPTTQLRRDQRVWVEFPVEHCTAIPDDGWRPRALARTFDDEET